MNLFLSLSQKYLLEMKNKFFCQIFVSFIILFYLGNPSNLIAQSTFFGTVSSIHDTIPIQNVTVKVIGSETLFDETDVNGYYEVITDPGNYQVQFTYLGYDTITIDTLLTLTMPIEINVMMNRYPYPIPWVTAVLSNDGNSCHVEWGLPSGPYEIIVDDGSAEDYGLWDEPGGGYAVMVVPEQLPSKLTGGRVYIGDGSFPGGSSIIGTQLRVGIVDNDGYMGVPTTILDSTTITVTNYGWLEFNNVFDFQMEDGVLLAVWQLNGYFDSAPIGIDTDEPIKGRSYYKNPSDHFFMYDSDIDVMIRAHVDGPNPGLRSNSKGVRELTEYSILRSTMFDPCLGPAYGTHTPIAGGGVGNTQLIDNLMGGGYGYFAYAIVPIYDFGSSIYTYSNAVSQGNNTINFDISLCNGNLTDSTKITLSYIDTCSNAEYQIYTNEYGMAYQDNVVSGYYDIHIEAINQSTYNVSNIPIFNDTTIAIEFAVDLYPPRNLKIDPVSNIASWDSPIVADILSETFEDSLFTPLGWWDVSGCAVGWHRMNYDSNYSFYIPPGDNYFAVADNLYSNFNGCDNNQDYLFTPLVSLIEGRNYYLQFDYYFDQKNEDNAYIVYKDDSYSQIEVFESLSSSVGWETKTIDISAFSMNDSRIVSLGFHHTDDSWYIPTGFAVDNVRVFSDESEIEGYQVYLDGILIDSVSRDQTNYQFQNLIVGQSYEVCVKAIYECSESESICEDLTYYEQPTYTLPYFEGWDGKQYLLNDWIAEGTSENWLMDNNTGSPVPSVSFVGNPEITGGYLCSITSPMINAENVLFGDVYLEFDVKLDITTTSILDSLKVELWDGLMWESVYTVTTVSDFNFTHHKIDVTENVLGNVVMLRIVASGENSANVDAWFIDNIHMYRECAEPELLVGEVDWEKYRKPSVKINWEIPIGTPMISEWFHWDDGENHTAVSANMEFFAAARWEPEHHVNYHNASVTKIRIFPYEGVSYLELRIWSGTDASELLYTEDVTAQLVPREWNEFILNDIVLIDPNKELWVGYYVESDIGTYPAGVDNGIAIEGYGDMVSTDGNQWLRLSDAGLFYNWNIQVFLVEHLKNHTRTNSFLSSNDSRSLSGFNIYRGVNNGDFSLYDQVGYEIGKDSYEYYDTLPNVNLQNGYMYQVTSEWIMQSDICESNAALSKLDPSEDFVYVFLDDVKESFPSSNLSVFPNPSNDYVVIESNFVITSVRILTMNGQIIMADNQFANNKKIITKRIDSGLYLLEVKTRNEVTFKKLIISH